MSLEAMLWALKSAPTESSIETVILVALADRAGGDSGFDGAYPSHQTVSEIAQCSVSTVKRHLANMEKRGVIRRGNQSVVKDFRADRRPVVWDLNKSSVRCTTAHNYERPLNLSDGSEMAERQLTAVSYKPSLNHKRSYVSSDDETSTKKTSKRDDYPQDFQDFWEVFPKRSGTNSKREAHKAWVKAVKEETPANLLVAAKNYAKATTDVENRSTIPMCSSWLNKGYWEQYIGVDHSPVDLLRQWWKNADVEAVAEHTGLRFSMSWPDVIPESQAARDELVFNARRDWIASVRDDAISVLKGAAA